MCTPLLPASLAACLLIVAVGCTRDYAADVRVIEAAFPTFSELRVKHLDLGECEYIAYIRGVLTVDSDCSLVTKHATAARPIDAKVRRDMERIADVASSSGRTLRRVALEFDPATGVPTWGEFSFDGREVYHYDSGWRARNGLPNGDSATYHPVDDDWYVEDW